MDRVSYMELNHHFERRIQIIDKEREMEKTDCIYVLQKGEERVSLDDHKSLLDLSCALMVKGCTESVAQKEIKGHKPSDDIYEVSFLDKHIKAVGMSDVEKVVHWMLSFGCNKISISKIGVEDEGTD